MLIRKKTGGDPRPSSDRTPRDSDEILAEATASNPERSFGVGLVIGIVLSIAFLLFVVQNTQTVRFDWTFVDFTMALWVALVASFLVGFASFPLLVFEWRRLRDRYNRRKHAKEKLRTVLDRR